MPPIVLKIKEQADGTLAPESGFVTHVKRGETIKFTAEEGATRLDISFKNGRSPLGPGVRVQYGEELEIAARFVNGQPGANSYPYDCSFFKGDRKLESKGGGILEIDPGR